MSAYAELGVVLLVLLMVGVWAVAIILGLYYESFWKD